MALIKVKNISTKKVFEVDSDSFDKMAPKHKRNFVLVGPVLEPTEMTVTNTIKKEIIINPPVDGKKPTRKTNDKK